MAVKRARGGGFEVKVKPNMSYESKDIEWYDTLAERWGKSRQGVVRLLNEALQQMEHSRPGSLDYLVSIYGKKAEVAQP